MSTSVTINSTNPDGKKRAKKISYVNPDASNDALTGFAKKLTALTENEYEYSAKIVANTYEPPEPDPTKKERTFFVYGPKKQYYSGESFDVGIYEDRGFYGVVYSSNDDTPPYIRFENVEPEYALLGARFVSSWSQNYDFFVGLFNEGSLDDGEEFESADIIIGVPETEDYQAAEVTIHAYYEQ